MELLSGTAHLQRGGRNPTEGAKNRARSLTEARYLSEKWKKVYFFAFFLSNGHIMSDGVFIFAP